VIPVTLLSVEGMDWRHKCW